MSRPLAFLAILAILAAGLVIYRQAAPGTTAEMITEASFSALTRGEIATVEVLETPAPIENIPLFLEDGSTIGLNDLQGKVLLVNLWASWCAPCQAEMAELEELQHTLGGDDFEVVAINNDFGGVTKAKATLIEWNVPGLKVYADPELKSGMGMAEGKLPTSFIVDRKGMVLAKYVGPLDWADEEAMALFRALIAR